MSGCGRLGFLREGWPEVKIRDIAALNPESVSKGAPPVEISYIDIAAVSAEGVDPAAIKTLAYAGAPSRAQRLVREGDTIISTVRPYLRARAFLGAELDGCVASTGFCVLRPTERVVPGYLNAATSTDDFYAHLESRQTGTAYPAVRPSDIGDICVPLPPLDQQRRISGLLAAVDATENMMRLQLQGVRQLGGALLTAILSGAHDVLRPRTRSKTGSRRQLSLPETWREVPLADVATVERGVSWSKASEVDSGAEGGTPVLRIGNVQSTGLDLRDILYLEGVRVPATKRLTPDSIVMVGSNGNADRVGNVCSSSDKVQGWAYASFLIGIHPNRDRVDAGFLFYVLSSAAVQREITAATSGSTGLKNIGLGWLRSLAVPLPPFDEQRRIADISASVDANENAMRLQFEGVRQLRAALLTTLLSGTHEIPSSYDRFLPGNDAKSEPDSVIV